MSDDLRATLDELNEGLNGLRVGMGKLETVVRMSIAEQRRVNELACRDVGEIRQEQRRLQGQWEQREETVKQGWRQMEKQVEGRIQRLDSRFTFLPEVWPRWCSCSTPPWPTTYGEGKKREEMHCGGISPPAPRREISRRARNDKRGRLAQMKPCRIDIRGSANLYKQFHILTLTPPGFATPLNEGG